ncbi:hypothetical protein ACOMHN_009835 [Nucella lapillus]
MSTLPAASPSSVKTPQATRPPSRQSSQDPRVTRQTPARAATSGHRSRSQVDLGAGGQQAGKTHTPDPSPLLWRKKPTPNGFAQLIAANKPPWLRTDNRSERHPAGHTGQRQGTAQGRGQRGEGEQFLRNGRGGGGGLTLPCTRRLANGFSFTAHPLTHCLHTAVGTTATVTPSKLDGRTCHVRGDRRLRTGPEKSSLA